MRAFALLIGLAVAVPATAQRARSPTAPATDEYVAPTHSADGAPFCDTLPSRSAPPDKPEVCALRPLMMVGGMPTLGSPWQVEILSTFKYTDEAVAEDNGLQRGQGKIFLAQKAGWERSHRCGGTLIAYDTVLTAAHCVWPKDNGDAVKTRAVRVGANDLSTPQGRTVGIRQVVVHAGYDPVTAANDIALLRLDWGWLAPRYPTIPLAGPGQPDAEPGRGVEVTGWGLTGARDPGGDKVLTRSGEVNHASAKLQQLFLGVKPQDACDAVPELRGASGPGTVCALAVTPDADSCQGDSGGPLTLSYRSWTGPKTILVGIVSQGVGCAFHATPALYTRVSFYRDWIARAEAVRGRGFALLP